MSDAISFKVKTSGPAFNGGLTRTVRAAHTTASKAVAETGVKLVKQRLGRQFKEPTGAYLSSVQTDRSVVGFAVTGNAVYGPWLEGTSSRNQSSRFKGYAAFRKAALELQGLSAKIAGPIIRRATGL